MQLASKCIENNLLIGGLKETEDEDCHHVVQKFLYDNPGIRKMDDGIYEAHRMGEVRKWSTKAHAHKVFNPTENDDYGQCQSTAGPKNEYGFSVCVTRQHPEAICEKQKHK